MIEKFIISLTKKSETKLDKLILENCPPSLSLSRTKIQDLIKRQMVFDPQKNDALTSKTKTNDIEKVILYVDKELQKNLIPEDLEVPIVFEDRSLVVFNKPANMVVHPVTSSQRGTLVNFLIYKYQDTLPTTYDQFRPGIIHRLDKDTSGLIVIAKTAFCANDLITQFKSREVKKIYLALCIGNPVDNLNKIIRANQVLMYLKRILLKLKLISEEIKPIEKLWKSIATKASSLSRVSEFKLSMI